MMLRTNGTIYVNYGFFVLHQVEYKYQAILQPKKDLNIGLKKLTLTKYQIRL